jgi:hypothetical protein
VARNVQATGLLIEVRDPKGLLPRVLLGKAAGEKCAGGGCAVELQRRFGTLIPHHLALTGRSRFYDANRIGFGW